MLRRAGPGFTVLGDLVDALAGQIPQKSSAVGWRPFLWAFTAFMRRQRWRPLLPP